jgi:hypothetical protein
LDLKKICHATPTHPPVFAKRVCKGEYAFDTEKC